MTQPPSGPLFEVRASPIHGQGVHAVRPLPSGTCLGTYEGRRYTAATFQAVDWRGRHDGLTYFFALSDGTTLDGADGGNDLRFLNHACEPNCEAVESWDDTGHLILQLVTVKDVPGGSELFLNYGLLIDERESAQDYLCRCGQRDCRGTMVAEIDNET